MTSENLIWLYEKNLKHRSFWKDKLGKGYKLIIPFSIDTEITKICNLLAKEIDIKFIYDDKFVDIREGTKFNKFFKY